MITGIHHVSFAVSDLDRALSFYQEGFGFTVSSDRVVEGPLPAAVTRLPGARLRVVHLRGHGIGLELIQYYEPIGRPAAPRPCDAGSAHLCFLVDDINLEMRRLEALGARLLSPAQTVDAGPNAGNRYVYLLDHDGIPIELSQPSLAINRAT